MAAVILKQLGIANGFDLVPPQPVLAIKAGGTDNQISATVGFITNQHPIG